MIISASRRTDIPDFYSEWFFNRIKEGYVLVPNPHNSKMISKISLNPAMVDCIVFWSKNPAPMIDKLDRLKVLMKVALTDVFMVMQSKGIIIQLSII